MLLDVVLPSHAAAHPLMTIIGAVGTCEAVVDTTNIGKADGVGAFVSTESDIVKTALRIVELTKGLTLA